jgi:protease secretion system membrane fusion protein
MQTQEQLLRSRRAALKADLQSMEENILGQQGLLQSYESMLNNRRSQLELLQEELKNTRELVKEGYAPRNRQLELERGVADAHASVADLLGNATRARQAVAELRQRAVAKQQEYRKEVETQLSDVTREVQSDAEKFKSVSADLDRTEIKSPAKGQVVGLVAQTVGGVVQAGQKVMDVVPEGEPLLLEARIQPHLIDKVRTGLSTDVRFTTFAHSPQLVVQGEVVSISTDLLSEQQGGTVVTYYLARIKLTDDGMKTLGDRRLQPGMPTEVVIKTGERSMLMYLLNPLTKRLAASMKEE